MNSSSLGLSLAAVRRILNTYNSNRCLSGKHHARLLLTATKTVKQNCLPREKKNALQTRSIPL